MKFKKSKYKGIRQAVIRGKSIFWHGDIYINGVYKRKTFPKGTTEKQAAKWVDIQLIRAGKDLVNILKKLI